MTSLIKFIREVSLFFKYILYIRNNLDKDEELKYTSSWDLLIPIYQKLFVTADELLDENWLYITNEMYDKLDVMTQTPKEFAYLLAEIIMKIKLSI